MGRRKVDCTGPVEYGTGAAASALLTAPAGCQPSNMLLYGPPWSPVMKPCSKPQACLALLLLHVYGQALIARWLCLRRGPSKSDFGALYARAKRCRKQAATQTAPGRKEYTSGALARSASGAGSHTCRGTGAYTPAAWPHWCEARAKGLGAARQSSTYRCAACWCFGAV
jgi:hypothetical protein